MGFLRLELVRIFSLGIRFSPALVVFIALIFTITGCQQGGQKTYRVERVVDGDTFVLEGDVAVRLLGIDTPEKERPYYEEASLFAKRMLEGKKVRLEYDIEKTDRYGRLLAYAFLPDGTFVNADLLEKGMASVYSRAPNIKYSQIFSEAQKKAREKKAGFWKLEVAKADYYVHSKRATTFHRPECQFAQKISKKNYTRLATREEALSLALSPCRNCYP